MNQCESTFDGQGDGSAHRLTDATQSMPGDRDLDCTDQVTLDSGIVIGRKALLKVLFCVLAILSLGHADVAAQQVKPRRLPTVSDEVATEPTPLFMEISTWVQTPILPVSDRQPIDVQTVIETTLVNAPEIRVLHSDVTIADTLTRGLNNAGGIRRRDRVGGSVNLGQDINFADSNSVFFNPANQATTRLGITYEVPLLRDSGRSVVTSRYEIAVAASNATREASIQGVQRQLNATTDAYWALMAARAEWAIQFQNVNRAEEVCRIISERSRIDSQAIQLARSKGTLASRQARLVRAFYAVEFAQQRLNRTVLGATFAQFGPCELIPLDNLLASPEP